jgi:hypothetical protein
LLLAENNPKLGGKKWNARDVSETEAVDAISLPDPLFKLPMACDAVMAINFVMTRKQ